MKFTFAPETRPLAGYTIKRAIDRGGFGEVYYALSDSGKEVALKLLQRNQQVELRGVSQCLNLKHPNLVTLFDIRTDDEGDHWVVMEYMSGRSLEQVLADHPQGMPQKEIEEWLTGLAAGISFLHDRGIVHRDLKPANVFRENGVVKIGDIGLSKYITPSRRSAQTESVGTVYYMAPEVAHGKYGSELDVYSLAVMVYEMLTGRVPFNGESTAEILMKHLTEPPDLNPIPASLQPVLARALEKDPKRRTASAMQLAEEFQRAVHGRPAIEVVRPIRELAGRELTRPEQPGRVLPEAQTTAPHRRRRRSGNEQLVTAAVVVGAVWLLTSRHGVISIPMLPLLAIFGALSYGAYFFVRFFIQTTMDAFAPAGPGTPPRTAPERNRAYALPPAAAAVRSTAPPITRFVPSRPTGSSLTPNTLRPITPRQRVADLAGSMTLAVIWSLIATGLGALVTPLFVDSTSGVADAGSIGLFALTTIIGSWMVLFTSKLCEGLAVEETTRRLIQTASGALVGAAAFWIDRVLMAEFTDQHQFVEGFIQNIGSQPLLTAGAQPTLVGYAVFFAALFGLRRWWLHADGFRPKRFRISSLLLTGLAGLFLNAALAFPRPWGLCWAVAICCVVQLSARWIPIDRRPAWMEAQFHG